MPEPTDSHPRRSKTGPIVGVALGALVILAAPAYFLVLPGFPVGRNDPPPLETSVATWLLHHRVPASDRQRVNPLGRDAAGITAGRELFRQKCESCHASDGGGKEEMGGGTL